MNIEEIRAKWPFENKVPREVQLAALAKGYGLEGFAYFMRQRLGKTWTAFAEFSMLRAEGKVDWFFVIAPNSIKEQWKQDIEEVDEFIPICVYDSAAKKKAYYYLEHNKNGGVFIINYESVKSFMEDEGWQKFNQLRTYIVADESTKIKEPNAKSSKACHSLSSFCSYKRVLTGKPTANSNADLWSQLKFIAATSRNFYQHKHYFCVLGGYQGRTIVRNINTDYLQKEMDPYSYIAEDKYIKGFEKIYEPLRKVQLTEEQQKLYTEMENELITELQDGTEITAPIILVKYLRLQQISSGVAGDPNGVQHNTITPDRNPRIKVVREILDNEVDHKVIIPCRFRLSIDNLYNTLTKDGYKVARLVGGMGEEIENEKQRFNSGEATVLLAQLQVLSYGHTLCGPDDNPCDSIIYYENDFSLLNRMQSESRPEKYLREIPISIYDLYASKMDKYIIQALVKKEDASMALMNYSRSYGMRPELSTVSSITRSKGNGIHQDLFDN